MRFDMLYTVYKITNKLTNKIYIGIHKTVDLEDGYMGSGKYIQNAIAKHGVHNFDKEYLAVFNNFEAMVQMETQLVDAAFVTRTDTYNLVLGGGTTEGMVPVKDKHGNTYGVAVTDQRYLSGELVPIASGFVTVKDKHDNTSRVAVTDPRYISGELVSVSLGMLPVKDKNGKKNYVHKTDPRYISGELVHISKGTALVRDTHNALCRVAVTDPRYISGELVPVGKGYKHTDAFKKKIGAIAAKSQKGKGNSQYGTVWVYSLIEKRSKKVKQANCQQWLDVGWCKGRKLKF